MSVTLFPKPGSGSGMASSTVAALPGSATAGDQKFVTDGPYRGPHIWVPTAGWHQLKNGVADVAYFGAKGDGVNDDTAAIQAAIDNLPAYTGGLGGAVVELGPGTFLVTSTIDHDHSGVTIRGSAIRSTKIIGTIAGPILQTALSGTAAEVYFFLGLEDLIVVNLSTNAAAYGLDYAQCTGLRAKRLAINSGGNAMLRMRSGDDNHLHQCRFQGAAANYGVLIDGTSAAGYWNLIMLSECSFQDTKCGVRAIGGSTLTIDTAQMEHIAGGLSGSLNKCISLDGIDNPHLKGTSYFDSNTPMVLGTNNSEDDVYDLIIDGLRSYNIGATHHMYLDAVKTARIGPMLFKNGALNANAHGIVVEAPATGVRLDRVTHRVPGTGTAQAVSGATNIYLPTQDADVATALAGIASAAPLIDDHFVTGSNTASLSLGSSGFGVTGGTGSAIASETGHPGIERCAVTNSNPTTGGFINRGGGVTGGPMMDENFDLQIKVRYGLNGGAKAQTTALRFGFSSTMISATDPTEAAYFECLAADTNWFAVTRIAGVQTRTDTTVAFGDTNWLTGRITRVGANVAFVLNGGTTINHTTNLPAGGGQFGATARTTEAVAKNIDLDRLTLYSIG